MNPKEKTALAFLLGAALATGGVLLVAKHNGPRTPAPVTTTAAARPVAVTAPAPMPAPATTPEPTTPAAQPSPQPASESPAAPQSKPSAVIPPRHRQERTAVNQHPAPAVVARNNAPIPNQPATAPVPAAPVEQPAPAPAVIPAPAPVMAPSLPPREEPPPQPRSVTLPAGTLITVRLGDSLSTDRNLAGDSFTATLDRPIIVDGLVIAERGSRASGRIIESDRGSRVQGGSSLVIELTQINTSDGQRVQISTDPFARHGEQRRREEAAKVGGGAVLGAIIGAIAGGGKGAAIGAGVGGAAGAGDVVLTHGKAAALQVETLISFRLRQSVNLTERLH